MAALALDHVNIRTADLPGLTRFYSEILGLSVGARPAYAYPGAWLYAGPVAIVHLVGVAQPPAGGAPQLEHFALRCNGLAETRARLAAAGVACRQGRVPGTDIVQLHLADPDGNHIELQFAAPAE